MNWVLTFLKSSIGRKLTMSLTGLFLILFLIVHLLGNLQLLKHDGGVAFNEYAYFMTHNPLIKTVSYSLYAFILLHTIQGLLLWRDNRKAKGKGYAVKTQSPKTEWASSNMALLGTLILFFLVIHMGDFWWKMKMHVLPAFNAPDFHGTEAQDLYSIVAIRFSDPIYVALYSLSMVVLYFHLSHGFQSAFQTMGWSHPKYTPLIKLVGKAYSILFPLGFLIIPIAMYFKW
jgi:succinate dehydrogenase / fumarate reductase, cytochrome b subunit